MFVRYNDILDRINEPPQWWDEHAGPRFIPFEPQRMANIYAVEAALVLITCQYCKRPFHVAFSEPCVRLTSVTDAFFGPPSLIRHQILSKQLHFGDPPNVDCCAGVTANSIPCRVLEYWVKPYALGEGIECVQHENGLVSRSIRGRNAMNWRREPELEREISPDLVA